MRYDPTPLRPGMAAIAAVLALSATPLYAQVAEGAPPLAVAPPAPTVIAAPPASDPAPAVGLNIPAIRVNVDSSEDAAATQEPASTPAANPVAARQSAPVATRIPERPAARPNSTEAPAVLAASPARQLGFIAPVAAKAVAPVAAAPRAAPEPAAPVASASAAPANPAAAANDDAIPVAGAAGLGLIALIGGAVALNRRKSRPEQLVDDRDAIALPVSAVGVSAAAPVMSRQDEPLVVEPSLPAMSDSPTAKLPSGFDLSRFGPHVQAAYRGPTPDNASLSLKNRLKRARFFDQRERVAGNSGGGEPGAPAAIKHAPASNAAEQRHGDFVVSRAKPRGAQNFRPVYQS